MPTRRRRSARTLSYRGNACCRQPPNPRSEHGEASHRLREQRSTGERWTYCSEGLQVAVGGRNSIGCERKRDYVSYFPTNITKIC